MKSVSSSETDRRPIQVLVAADCPLLQLGIGSVIGRERDMVLRGVVGDAGATLDAIVSLRPDVVTIALPLRRAGTYDLIRDVSLRKEGIPVLVVSFEDDPVLAKRVSCSGAKGFIARGEPAECMVEAIRQLARGLSYVGAKPSPESARALGGTGGPRFTNREREVIRFIGEGLTPREIATALRLSTKTVESHRQNIKQKLGIRTAARLAQYAFHWVRQNRPLDDQT